MGVILYLLLSQVLPFDDLDENEIARQTLYDAPDFTLPPFDAITNSGKDLCKSNYIIIKYLFLKYRTSRKEP
jgi:hypothetical protein